MTIQDRFKFRVWDETECKYVEYYLDYDLTFAIDIDGKLIAYASDYSDHSNCDDGYFDDGYIVEQCTGLKDKNGKLIYEGDIVEVQDEDGYKYVVEWCINGFAIDDGLDYLTDDRNIIVVGNIHENADLLENKDENV